jgi:hypothetical protein
MSTDQFTSTGFSQVRTVGPDDQAPAGAWVIADDFVPVTSVVATPNCPLSGIDIYPLRVVALKLTPTIGSWQDADIQEVDLIQDNNCDAQYDPGLDFTMQTKTGSELQQGKSVTFVNGPASPLFVVGGGMPPACGAGATGIMVVVKIGPNPLSGTQFGLSLEGLSTDIPGLGPMGFSSSFSSSRNPQGSSLRLQIIGGGTGGPSPTPTPTPHPIIVTPPPGGSTLKAFDKNSNCKLDDPEFFSMIDGWIASSVTNTLFFAGVDAWIGQSSVCTAAAAAALQSVTLSMNPAMQTALFEAHGQNIDSMGLEVFSLNGQSTYSSEAAGSHLRWNLRAHDGQILSNGVYLYRVSVKGPNGQILRTEVRKFVVLR